MPPLPRVSWLQKVRIVVDGEWSFWAVHSGSFRTGENKKKTSCCPLESATSGGSFWVHKGDCFPFRVVGLRRAKSGSLDAVQMLKTPDIDALSIKQWCCAMVLQECHADAFRSIAILEHQNRPFFEANEQSVTPESGAG